MSTSKLNIVVSALTRAKTDESLDCKATVELARQTDYMHSPRKQANPQRKRCFLSASFTHQLYHHAADPRRRSHCHSSDVCSSDVCSPDVCSSDVCSPDVCSPDVVSPDVCSSDVLSSDVCSSDVCSLDVCSTLTKPLTTHYESSEDDADWEQRSENAAPSTTQVVAIGTACQTHLALLRERIAYHHYNQGIYFQIIDSLTTIGVSLPVKEVMNILEDLLKSDSSYFINRISRFLNQDFSFMTASLSVENRSLWILIDKSLAILKKAVVTLPVEPSKSPGLLAGKIVLEYIFNVFVNDLRSNHPGSASMLEQVLIITSKCAWHNKFLDLVFYILSRFVVSENIFLTECVDILLGLSLLPIVTCTSKVDQEESSTTVANDISKGIDQLSTTHKKHFLLTRIPSDSVRVKVIDIHLDNYFMITTTSTCTVERQPFSLLKIKDKHLNKSLLKADGTRQEIGHFLCLLTLLLQSYLLVVTGVPVLHFLPDMMITELQSTELFQDLKDPIMVFINRLSTDPETSADITTPTNWCYLEILMALTS